MRLGERGDVGVGEVGKMRVLGDLGDFWGCDQVALEVGV